MALPYQASISYLTKLTNHPLLFLEKQEHFVKASSRNRCFIFGANGIQLLSIPVLGGRSHKQAYQHTQIDHRQNWQRQHWQSLQSAYGKSPFFEYYETELGGLYQVKHNLLWDWNLSLLSWLFNSLRVQIEPAFTEVYEKHLSTGTDFRAIPLRDPSPSNPPYYQCFSEKHGFITDLAGIDLLFNLGPSAAWEYLRQLSNR